MNWLVREYFYIVEQHAYSQNGLFMPCSTHTSWILVDFSLGSKVEEHNCVIGLFYYLCMFVCDFCDFTLGPAAGDMKFD